MRLTPVTTARPPGRHVRGAARLLLATALASTLGALAQGAPATAAASPQPKPATKPDPRPNVVLITTDDQTLADLRYMPRTRHLIADRGVTFTGVSPHPLCCPARAEILTGQFAQNNGVRSNIGRYGGYERLRTRHTIATWLHRAGYRTMFMGKFLNGYNASSDVGAAPGWDDWNPTVRGVYNYRNFTVRHNDRLRHYSGHQTDLFTDLAVDRITTAAERPRPFFLWQSYVAPHAACPPSEETERCWTPPHPADRHLDRFPNAIPPSMSSPAFNEQDLSDKPFPLRKTALLGEHGLDLLLQMHRDRLRSLLAVDEGVARTVAALRSTGELEDTLILFASDNGFLLGEHRYVGKVMPYEPSLRVPLLMRGPGVPEGVTRKRVATLVDLAPTIVAVARAEPTVVMDGRNLLPVARRATPSWSTLLIQAGTYRLRDEETGWFYRGVRTARYTYAYYPFRGQSELYDRRIDPDQLDNVATDPRYEPVVQELARRTAQLGDCTGRACRRSFGPVPGPLPQDPGTSDGDVGPPVGDGDADADDPPSGPPSDPPSDPPPGGDGDGGPEEPDATGSGTAPADAGLADAGLIGAAVVGAGPAG